MAIITKSLVTQKQYVAAQARDAGDGRVHIQVPNGGSGESNRDYGFSADVENVALATFLAAHPVKVLRSLAGTDKMYTQVQLTTIGYWGKVHVQVFGSGVAGANRDYGFADTFAHDALAEFVAANL